MGGRFGVMSLANKKDSQKKITNPAGETQDQGQMRNVPQGVNKRSGQWPK